MVQVKKYFWSIALLWSVGMVLLGVFISPLMRGFKTYANVTASSELRSHGRFTNPLLECELGGSISSRKEDFTPELTAFVNALKRQSGISSMAVYYRDLNNGPIIGINRDIFFAPASLLKVPIMMTYLSHDESHPGFLETRATYLKMQHLLPEMQKVPPAEHIVLGKDYSYRQLIEYMIKYSDNEAMALLYDSVPVEEQIDLYTLLGVDPQIITDPSQQLSVRQYSIFFRILFNASYLSRQDSEYALKLLSETTFNDGLRVGVPTNILMSHKFGERQDNENVQQFHDCGIVYYPDHPYLLCVMTRGNSTPTLLRAIADTSTFVYDKIDAQYGN